MNKKYNSASCRLGTLSIALGSLCPSRPIDDRHPFVQGLSMPIHGLDHMVVKFAVGLIAVQMGGAALWVLPCAFSLLLLLGGTLNVCGVSVPLAEQAIFASMIVVGGLLSFRRRESLLVTLAIVGAAATFHGNVLIGEAPHNSWFSSLHLVVSSPPLRYRPQVCGQDG